MRERERERAGSRNVNSVFVKEGKKVAGRQCAF